MRDNDISKVGRPTHLVNEILNIAGYKFVELDRLPERRRFLLRECRERSIKGTILLSHEGINLFLAAPRSAIDGFLALLREDPALADFHVKESPCDRQPFNRLLVRLKKEIISFGVEGIDPAHSSTPKLKPSELKRWLDEKRPVTLLDVRNNYEVELGTFHDAVVADIDHFRQFPQAVQRLATLNDGTPIVMFCTGGIRCEKAGPFMQQAGFDDVYQLDGGILQYFEDCGGEHYDGDCFVFDQRVAVNSRLQETAAEVCFVCQAVLGPEQQASPRYVPGESCPVCYRTPEARLKQRRQEVRFRIAQVTSPLPGSIPYENHRPLNVPRRFHGWRLIDFLAAWHSHIPRDEWETRIAAGQFRWNDRPLQADDQVRDGQRLVCLMPATVEPDVNADIDLIYEDHALVVVNKPAPLPMHPSGRFNRNTLIWILDQVYDHPLRAAHRLDANTTGAVIFSRTRKAAAFVQSRFESREFNRQYLVMVHGSPAETRFSVEAPITDQPTWGGGRRSAATGKHCRTDFQVLATLPDRQASLLLARPRTGRTNQIRIHLWEAGHPVVGDPTYLRDRLMADTQTLGTTDEPMCLHAWKISLVHPETRQPVEFTAELPAWTATCRQHIPV
jgi:RluA family pseudouridine synthase